MAISSTVPIIVAPEAAARIEELGMRREFEQMLEQIGRHLPDTRSIEVELGYDYEEEREPIIVINPRRPEPESDEDPFEQQWIDWFLRTFPPEVVIHFVMLSFYERDDGR